MIAERRVERRLFTIEEIEWESVVPNKNEKETG
jgi:hypothetical protein